MSESGDIGGRSFYRFLNRKFFSELGEAVHTDLFAFEFPVHVGQSVQPYRDDFVFPVFFQCNPFGIAPVFFERSPMPKVWIQLQREGLSSLSQLLTFQ